MKRGRGESIISVMDKKILDYLDKNKSCCITGLIKKWKSGSNHLKKHFDYLLKVGLIGVIKKEKSPEKDYFIKEDKRKEIDFILSLPTK